MNLKKRKLIYTLMLGFALILTQGCHEDENTEETAVVAPPTVNEYFIEGKVNNVMVRAEYRCPYAGCERSTGNFNEFMSMITMQRTVSETDGRGWYIYINNVTLDSWQIPDTLDASQYSYNENLRLSYYSGPHESENNYLVDNVVLGDNSFQMIVSSKAGDIIQGTFKGQLRNGSDTDNRVTVTDGKFRIKIVRT